jgi:hypothetical protein
MDIYRQVLPVPMEDPWGGDPVILTGRNRGVMLINVTASPAWVTLEAKTPVGNYIEFQVNLPANSNLTLPLIITSVISTDTYGSVYVNEIF